MKNQKDTNGNKHGLWEEYHSNEKLWHKGYYKNGRAHGLSEWYYSSGELCYKGAYKKSNPVGLWYSSSKQTRI